MKKAALSVWLLFILTITSLSMVSANSIKLVADDGAEGDRFGRSASIDGDVALLGAISDDDNGENAGSAYVFRWNGNSWVQEQKLLADDGAEGDGFGRSVSINGDLALLGAISDDDNGEDAGSAYVFRWNGNSWVQEQKLLADDGTEGNRFGGSVSINGNVALVGARFGDDNGEATGSAYVFRWNGNRWVQEQKLLPDELLLYGFGYSVSINGDVALVGGVGDLQIFPDPQDPDMSSEIPYAGAAYVFRWNGVNWVQEQMLVAEDADFEHYFGNSVSISGDVALVGAVGDNEMHARSGAAYVFLWNGNSWVQEQKLIAVDSYYHHRLGTSVSISGNVALVGAVGDEDNGRGSGAAYVFRRNGGSWKQEPKLLAIDPPNNGHGFGTSVSLSGDIALVGAFDDAYVHTIDENKTNIGNKVLFDSTSTSNFRRAMPFTMSEDGTIESITIYHEGGGGDMILGVYEGRMSPGNLLAATAQTAVNGSDGWQTVRLTNPVFIPEDKRLWLAWVFENNPGIRYGIGSQGRAQSDQYWPGGMPDRFGNSSQADYRYSIYATYTIGGRPYSCVLDSKFDLTTIDTSAYYYTDRNYTITGGIPAWMIGRTLIQTPNDEKKNNSDSGYIRFTNPVDWWVYVLFDSRSSSVPDWLTSWERYTKYPDMETSLATQPGLKMYRKMFDAGQCVDLGGNYGPGSSGEYRSNYVVVYGK